MATITADDLEIDVRDTTQLERVRAEMVRRHEQDLERLAERIAELEAANQSLYLIAKNDGKRIAELQAQLAQARADAQSHVQEWQDKANALQQERDRWKRECLETNRLDAGLQAELGKQLLEMKRERDAAREDARVLAEKLFLLSERYRVRSIHNGGVSSREEFIVVGRDMKEIHETFNQNGAKYLDRGEQ